LDSVLPPGFAIVTTGTSAIFVAPAATATTVAATSAAAITATTTATIAAASAAAAIVTTTAAGRAISARARFIDRQITTLEVLAVELLDGCCRFFRVVISTKPKPRERPVMRSSTT
jgi:hypothetical protein